MGRSPGTPLRAAGCRFRLLDRRAWWAFLLVLLYTAAFTALYPRLRDFLFGTALPGGTGSAIAPALSTRPAAGEEDLRTVHETVRPGTGFAENLIRAGLSRGLVPEVAAHLAPWLDFHSLQIGDRFTLVMNASGELRSLTYETGPSEAVLLAATAEGWRAGRVALPVTTRVAEIKGRIGSSLFESLERLGEEDTLTMAFVDIFIWDIDFSHELQPGDTFRILVEKIYRNGDFVAYGKILAGEYRDREEVHRAYFFPWPAGGGDYYSPEGRSLRRTFLRAPVAYSRISSRFSTRRLHPVLRNTRPHPGVDYAAPTGTPVWAPADGTVLALTSDRQNGRKIVLRHPNGYRTYFLHLSRFARGIKIGKKVRQKEVIGFVGSSGLATGPHLDYRMKRRGVWRNPLQEQFPRGRPLPESLREEFSEYRQWLDGNRFTPIGQLLASFLSE